MKRQSRNEKMGTFILKVFVWATLTMVFVGVIQKI